MRNIRKSTKSDSIRTKIEKNKVEIASTNLKMLPIIHISIAYHKIKI